jgi:hypothetical protein
MIGVMGAFFLALEPFHEFLQIDNVSLMVPLADDPGTVRGSHSISQNSPLSLDKSRLSIHNSPDWCRSQMFDIHPGAYRGPSFRLISLKMGRE